MTLCLVTLGLGDAGLLLLGPLFAKNFFIFQLTMLLIYVIAVLPSIS